ncbi:MAG: fructose-bisphosphate aldolase [Actinomycetia bacterium]|nr:fructose-bisphosphate aldolase [Actinomycetes bacterium]
MTKVNIATQLNKMFTGAVRDQLAADSALVDTRRYLGAGRDATTAEVAPLFLVLLSTTSLMEGSSA